MAIDTALIQTGNNLSKATTELSTVDVGKAFGEGEKLIQDQLAADKKIKEHDEDREFDITRKEQAEELRTIGLEQKLTMYNAGKGEYFKLIDEAYEAGEYDKAEYTEFLKDKEKYWQDSGNQVKFFNKIGNKEEFKKELEQDLTANANWGGALKASASIAPSDSDAESQEWDYAIEGWKKENGNNPPPIVKKDGKRYFKLPRPGKKGDPIFIPVSRVAEGDGTGIFGEDVTERITFGDITAGFLDKNVKLDKLLRSGKGTKNDLDSIGTYFDKQAFSDIEMEELADDLFVMTGFEADKYGIKDIDGDGKITFQDLDNDPNTPGVQYDKQVMKQIFQDMVIASSDYPEQKGKPGKPGDYTNRERLASLYVGGAFNADLKDNLVGLISADGKTIQSVTEPGTEYVDEEGKTQVTSEWIIKTEKGTYRVGGDPTNGPNKDSLNNVLGIKVGAAQHKVSQAARDYYLKELKINPKLATIQEIAKDSPLIQTGAPEPPVGVTTREKAIHKLWSENNFTVGANGDVVDATQTVQTTTTNTQGKARIIDPATSRGSGVATAKKEFRKEYGFDYGSKEAFDVLQETPSAEFDALLQQMDALQARKSSISGKTPKELAASIRGVDEKMRKELGLPFRLGKSVWKDYNSYNDVQAKGGFNFISQDDVDSSKQGEVQESIKRESLVKAKRAGKTYGYEFSEEELEMVSTYFQSNGIKDFKELSEGGVATKEVMLNNMKLDMEIDLLTK